MALKKNDFIKLLQVYRTEAANADIKGISHLDGSHEVEPSHCRSSTCVDFGPNVLNLF